MPLQPFLLEFHIHLHSVPWEESMRGPSKQVPSPELPENYRLKHFASLFTSFASHDMIGDIQIFSVFHVNYFNIFLAQNVGNFEIDGFKSEIVMCIIKNVIKKGLIM